MPRALNKRRTSKDRDWLAKPPRKGAQMVITQEGFLDRLRGVNDKANPGVTRSATGRGGITRLADVDLRIAARPRSSRFIACGIRRESRGGKMSSAVIFSQG